MINFKNIFITLIFISSFNSIKCMDGIVKTKDYVKMLIDNLENGNSSTNKKVIEALGNEIYSLAPGEIDKVSFFKDSQKFSKYSISPELTLCDFIEAKRLSSSQDEFIYNLELRKLGIKNKAIPINSNIKLKVILLNGIFIALVIYLYKKLTAKKEGITPKKPPVVDADYEEIIPNDENKILEQI